MTELIEISSERMEVSLAFCRECLGWPDASFAYSQSIFENRRRPGLSHAHSRMTGFQLDPTDPSKILNAVKEWCDGNAVSLSLKYSPGASSHSWHVRLAQHVDTHGDDLCDVLLRACLAADRQIAQRSARKAEIDLIPERHNPATLADP